jgi:hypothetical protein
MQLTLPAAPSKRDRDIYYAVRSYGMKQVDVAKEFHVSQPRISQILKKVTEWTAKFAPLQGLGAEEEIFVAQDAYVHKMEWYEQRARDAFEQTCYQEPPIKAEEGEKRAVKQPPRAKPDAKLLQSGMTAAKAIVEGTKEKAAAKKAAREAIEKCQLQSEDGMVRELYEHCRGLSKQAKKLATLGFEVPAAPAWDWNRIERTIRDRLRGRGKRNYQHARWLPDDWQAYGNQLLDLPFDKTPPEVVAAVKANPEPVKSNYVPEYASPPNDREVESGLSAEERLRIEAACARYQPAEASLSPPVSPVVSAVSAPAEAPKPKPVNPSKRPLYKAGFEVITPEEQERRRRLNPYRIIMLGPDGYPIG